MIFRPSSRPRPGGAALAALAIAIGGMAAGVSAVPAGAQTPTLTVGAGALPATQTSTVTVNGSGYLVPPHADGRSVFGGVYVMFGWVAGGSTWGPSNRNGVNSDGQFGITYSYAGASRSADTRDDGTGHNRFVSFTGGGISGESTDYHMTSEDPGVNSRGSWSTTLNIPGSTYQWTDPATGVTQSVDCLRVQCGVYTIGAHGVASATNERFVPITFSTGGAPVTIPPPPPGVTVAPGGATGTPAPGAPSASGGPTPTPPPAVGGVTTSRGTPKTTVKGSTATTAPTIAPTETAPADSIAAAPVEETTTTAGASTTEPAPSSTTTRPDDEDVTNSAAGRVIVLQGDESGVGGWVWGLGVGTPLLAAAGAVLWRRRSASVSGRVD